MGDGEARFLMSEDNDTEDQEQSKTFLGLVIEDRLGVAVTYQFNDEILASQFTALFTAMLNDPSNSTFQNSVSKCVDKFGMTMEEARDKVSKLKMAVAVHYSKYAESFFRENIQQALKDATTVLGLEAEVFARCVLDGFTIELEEAPVSYSQHEPPFKELQNKVLGRYNSNLHKHLLQSIKSSRRALERQVSPEFFEDLEVLCNEIKKYHDAQKIIFDGSKSQHRKPTNEQWVSEWLKIAREQFDDRQYHGIKDRSKQYPDWFFKRFASHDSSESNPKAIALDFAATLHGLATSSYKKRILPSKKKLDKNQGRKLSRKHRTKPDRN
jgi:hypothetical protein